MTEPQRPAIHPDVDDFLTHLEKERGVSPNTIKAYARDCAEFVAFLVEYNGGASWQWSDVDRLTMRGFMARLSKRGLSKRSIARSLAGVRGLYRYLATNDMVEANPARAVWGTDWPHIGPHTPGAPRPVVYMPIDNLALLRLLGQAAPDAATRQRILADNPARLYGFDAG